MLISDNYTSFNAKAKVNNNNLRLNVMDFFVSLSVFSSS